MDSSRSRFSYHRRLFVWLVGYSLLIVGCFVAFQYHREKKFKSVEINAGLQAVNRMILARLDAGADIRDIACGHLDFSDSLRVSVLDRRGYVVYDSRLDSLRGADHGGREEIRTAMTRGEGYSVQRHSVSTGTAYFYSATRGRDGCVVRTAIPYSVSLDSLLRADYGFLWVMGGVTALMCLLGYLATRRLGQNISRLNAFARRVERGEPISESEPFPHDELGEISSHIVRLYSDLQQANAARAREHRAAMREQQEKERIKRELTDNINHELKTPVAAIRLCLETIAGHPAMDSSTRSAFVGRSLDNCERLERLLADVSLLTRLDDGNRVIEKESLDLAAVIADVVADKEAAARDAGLRLLNGVAEPLPVTGNGPLLASVFSNLIDNAVLYSHGSEVEIRSEHIAGGGIVIIFADNGIGVSPQHLPRLFERFYRVDKGRSRAAGGTGLGLSIVRNAVAFHGGTIDVENRHGGGLLFRIFIKA